MTAQDLPLSAAETAGHPAQSGLGDGHHVRRENSPPDCFLVLLTPDGARLHLPRRRAGLVHPAGAVLAGVITLEADFCIEAAEEAPARHGTPEIFNSDQGSQFTSTGFIKVLAAREIKTSMDGKGAWRANVFVERLWRTIKYAEVYLRAYTGVSEARASIGRYPGFYNTRRPHSSLDGKTPDQAYFNPLSPVSVAA